MELEDIATLPFSFQHLVLTLRSPVAAWIPGLWFGSWFASFQSFWDPFIPGVLTFTLMYFGERLFSFFLSLCGAPTESFRYKNANLSLWEILEKLCFWLMQSPPFSLCVLFGILVRRYQSSWMDPARFLLFLSYVLFLSLFVLLSGTFCQLYLPVLHFNF